MAGAFGDEAGGAKAEASVRLYTMAKADGSRSARLRHSFAI
jgi:hypothetical protein